MTLLRLQALEETKMNQVRIITELEKEKKKMQDDVQKLKDAKVRIQRIHLNTVMFSFIKVQNIVFSKIRFTS